MELAEIVKKLIEAENKDSLEFGNPTRGRIKIYGDFADIDVFRKKIDNAIAMKEYANTLITWKKEEEK